MVEGCSSSLGSNDGEGDGSMGVWLPRPMVTRRLSVETLGGGGGARLGTTWSSAERAQRMEVGLDVADGSGIQPGSSLGDGDTMVVVSPLRWGGRARWRVLVATPVVVDIRVLFPGSSQDA